MPQRKIVIGDVHGHYDGLMQLLDKIGLNSHDQLYFLGDLIDRGPKSAEVVQFVKDHDYPCLLGNHEQMLLNVFKEKNQKGKTMQTWLMAGGHSTVNSYGDDGIPYDHKLWFQQLPCYIDLGNFWLVHAGVDPKRPIQKQNSDQFCWIRDEFHATTKRYFPDKLIITGHTITFTLPDIEPGQLASGPGWLCIETGVYHSKSGWLTGLDITNGLVYQINILNQSSRCIALEDITIPINRNKIKPVEIDRPKLSNWLSW